MTQEAYKKLELEEIATILELVNPELQNTQFDPLQTTILSHPLEFYPGYTFLDISDHTVSPPLQRFVIYKDNDIVVINWSNEPIYSLNMRAPIQITQENLNDYIRFFFTYVRGKHGRFIMCENVDDIHWKEEPPIAAKKAIGKMLIPLQASELGQDGIIKTKATMLFRDSLFKSDLEIKPNGLITILNEELLVEDMPILDDLFGQ